MPDLLNGVASGAGAGPSNMTIMRGGRFSKTIVTNVPGAEISSSNDVIPSNLVAYMGGVFHSLLTDVWATAPDNGTATPVWTTRNTDRVAGGESGRCGFYPCMTSAGPGLVCAWVNPVNGTTRMARWDYLTDAITFFDQPSGLEFDVNQDLGAGIVVGNLFFIGGKDGSSHRVHVFNIENGAFTQDTLFGAYSIIPLTTLNGLVYAVGRNGSNFPSVFVWLGAWVQVATDSAAGQNIGAPTSGVTGMLGYARKGKIYLGSKKNAGDGLSLWEYDPAIPNVLTEVTGIVDGTIAAPSPGLPVTLLHCYGFYVDVDTLGVPRYMIQVVPARKTSSPGCVLYEHTDAGIVLVDNTDLALGTNCLQQAPYCVAGLTFSEGNLWSLKIAEPTPDPLGMLLTYRFGGDPGNADSVIRIAVASPLGAPDARANTLVAPAGGLGQVGATLVEESPGVWRVDGWDANGVDDLTVVHRTLIDLVANNVLTDWTVKVGKS